MSYSSLIMESVEKYPELKIIDAQKVYKEKFSAIPEQAFYQTVSRMAKSGEIIRITKGIYCKPRISRFGTIISTENNILEYYLGRNQNEGVVVGYRMYNKYGLTTQISKGVELYSNIVLQEKRQIRNVLILKADLKYDAAAKRMIELLEVLENYKKIEDLNRSNLKEFIKISVEYYEEKILKKILKEIGYKKSTLASLKSVLDSFSIKNTIDNYLNGTSKYDILKMEELYETT